MGLIEDLEKKLEGGKFRLLNEKMYRNKDLTAEESKEYHVFYTNQVKKWPADPKNVIIQKIKENGHEELRIADIGCGSATMAETFANVVSFDKHPTSDKVIKCPNHDIKAEENSFDVAVCCLSLMKNNITGELKEVSRILKKEGVFYIAEVASRIKNTRKFISDVEKLGFKLSQVDTTNTHFVVISFIKKEEINTEKKIPSIMLGEWKYKKR